MEAIILGRNFMVRGQFSGEQFSSGAIVWGEEQFSSGGIVLEPLNYILCN